MSRKFLNIIITYCALVLLICVNSFASQVIVAGGANPNKKAEDEASGANKSKVIVSGKNSIDIEFESLQNTENLSATAWGQTIDGKWQMRENGELLKKTWYTDTDGHKYYLDAHGYLMSGFIKVKEEGIRPRWFLTQNKHNGYYGALITKEYVKVKFNGVEATVHISQTSTSDYDIGQIIDHAKLATELGTITLDYILDNVEIIDE
ncbi:MAG: hypothetical protein Q4F88_05325 [Eubacteriales bacterium]|nr:hypothetical protein [Eubacteriales bacterium]